MSKYVKQKTSSELNMIPVTLFSSSTQKRERIYHQRKQQLSSTESRFITSRAFRAALNKSLDSFGELGYVSFTYQCFPPDGGGGVQAIPGILTILFSQGREICLANEFRWLGILIAAILKVRGFTLEVLVTK